MRVRIPGSAWAPWLWMAAIWLLAHLSPVERQVPSLGLVRGPVGVALLALAAGVSMARGFGDGRAAWRSPTPGTLFAITFALAAAVGVRYVERLTASGDEPHYLLMAQSLWREGDLDLRDNVERGDYREYFAGSLAPHWGAPRRDGRPFPAHSPGLPVLLAPVYALGGRTACVVFFALLLAALGGEVGSLARRLTGDHDAALLAWCVSVGPPALAYSFHLYTELPSALAIVFALRLLLGDAGVAGAAVAACAVSTLPWLHLKMIPAAAALGVIGLLRLRGRARWAFLAVALVSTVSFLGYYQWIFGAPTPLALYGGGVPPDTGTSPIRAAAGLLLDRSFGLLPYAPVFLIAFAGVPSSARWPRRDGLLLLGVTAAIVVPLLDWRMWWGGQCPPARFLVPAAPLLAVLVAARAAARPTGLVRWRVALVSAGLALAAFMAATPEARLMLNRGDRATRVWAALSAGTPVGRYLPSLVANSAAEQRVALLWAAAGGILLALDALARRHDWADRLFRGMGLPLLLGLGVTALVDAWARAGEPAPTADVSSTDAGASARLPSSCRADLPASTPAPGPPRSRTRARS